MNQHLTRRTLPPRTPLAVADGASGNCNASNAIIRRVPARSPAAHRTAQIPAWRRTRLSTVEVVKRAPLGEVPLT
jgi:hypothetical protein